MVLPSLALSARRRAVLLLSLGTAASTTPLAAQYGGWLEEMDLTTQLSAAVTYDSNLLQTDPEIDDVILIGGASAELSREFRFATLSATLSGNVQRFLDYDVLNNADVFLNWGIDSGETLGNRRFRFQVDFDVQEGSSADLDVRGRVTTRRYSTGGTLTYRASSSIEAGVGLRYSKSDPQGGVFRLDPEEGLVETDAAFGNETLTYLANLRYIRTARLSFFAQASHSETESENSARGDSENQRYSVGVDGQILATLSGRLGAGLQTRSFDGEETTSPYVEGSLNWRINELTGASLSLRRSFDTSLNGAEAVRNTVSANVNRRLSRRLSAQAGISYNFTEFEFAGNGGNNPETRNLQLNAGGSYILTASSAVTATVTWNSLESDLRSGRNDSSNRLRTMLAYQYTF